MIAMKRLMIALALVFIAGCIPSDFSYGASQVSRINSRYNVTMETYPMHLKQIDSMGSDLKELKKIKFESGTEPLSYLIDYRLLNLEAERLYILGQKYGDAGTTKFGFGCKSKPLIMESAHLRNSSASKGFEAAALLKEFVAKYPKESSSVGLSLKSALFLNATFYQIYQSAAADSGIAGSFCQDSEVLESYKREFRKETNMSIDAIDKLTYEEAVSVWKEKNGLAR